MATRVLVTGGAGYLGSILCEHLLNADCKVTVLDTLIFGQKPHFHFCANPSYEFVLGDARNEIILKKLLAKSDVVIPLAAVVGAPACDQDPELAKSLNLDGIEKITKLCSPSQFIIYPMTNSGYGTKSGEIFCTEETPLEPISLYGKTKCDAEKIVLNSGNAVSLRLATVFGMSPRLRLDLLVNYFTYMAFSEGSIIIYEKEFKRNFIHIRDVANCMLHCIENSKKMNGEIYNLGQDTANMSKEELALKIKDQVPGFYIHFAENGSDPDKRNYIVSNRKLNEAGFSARYSIEDGIRELLMGYRMLKGSRLPVY
jgi:nucleoside-diphosphate-sugar epimerase